MADMHEEGKRRYIPAVWVSGDFLPSSEADLALERQGRFDKHSWCKSSCYLSLLACDWPVFLVCNPDPILTQTQVGAGLWKENNSHTWSKNTCKILKLWYFCKIHQNIIGHQNKSIQIFLTRASSDEWEPDDVYELHLWSKLWITSEEDHVISNQ